jgi:hypothetical protein
MSSEQRTENPRVENSVITPVNRHPEGSDLIEAFLCLRVLCGRHYSCLFVASVVLKMWLLDMHLSPWLN